MLLYPINLLRLNLRPEFESGFEYAVFIDLNGLFSKVYLSFRKVEEKAYNFPTEYIGNKFYKTYWKKASFQELLGP